MAQKFVVWLSEVGKEDIPLVGGKGANLGEMSREGFPVPPAFIITSFAYFYFLEKNHLDQKIKQILKDDLDWENPETLQSVSKAIRKLILTSRIPDEIAKEILKHYEDLEEFQGSKVSRLKRIISKSFMGQPLVAVRSSATAEDLPNASFAGQQETFLNTKGDANLLENVRRCWASLWLPRAIFYRHEAKFDHFKIGIAVPVQKMIQSEKSGVMFTIDPLNSDKRKIIIEAIYGLGEMIVQGQLTPDHYEVEKEKLKILGKKIAEQEVMLTQKGTLTKEFGVPKKIQSDQKITNEQIIKIAQIGKKLQEHYFFPQDVEWAIEKNEIYIVQTRPVTTIRHAKFSSASGRTDSGQARMTERTLKQVQDDTNKRKPVLTGIAASPGIASGPVKLIKSAKEIHRVIQGDMLVAEMTNPDFVPAMKKVIGIITDKGGRTAHAAIVSRELGIPCVVGTNEATKKLKNGEMVTINGETGEIFRGGIINRIQKDLTPTLSFQEREPQRVRSSENLKTATKVYVNLAEPERAEEISKLPVDGVGLLRAEFMMAQIGTHPKKIIKDRKQKLFVDKLSSKIAIFCEAFHPRPVVYRTSDFKTNEYRNLVGGEKFEPQEENPMIGFRGTGRYLADPAVFEMELEAIKRVRNKMNLRNLWLMLPFVRTPKELLAAKKLIASVGLIRSPSFKLWLMVEIPSNVILLEDFLKVGIDGVSIGSNDLTMLILGLDRDNSEVAQSFNEEDQAVLWAIEKVVKTCLKFKITCSLCGQAASDYPDLLEKLVSWGITSVSVNPDRIDQTREIIYQAEKRILNR